MTFEEFKTQELAKHPDPYHIDFLLECDYYGKWVEQCWHVIDFLYHPDGPFGENSDVRR